MCQGIFPLAFNTRKTRWEGDICFMVSNMGSFCKRGSIRGAKNRGDMGKVCLLSYWGCCGVLSRSLLQAEVLTLPELGSWWLTAFSWIALTPVHWSFEVGYKALAPLTYGRPTRLHSSYRIGGGLCCNCLAAPSPSAQPLCCLSQVMFPRTLSKKTLA